MRRALALSALLGMVVLAGCTGGAVNQAALQKNATYDWNTSAAVTVNASTSQYRAVYTLENDSSVRLSLHDELGGTQPIAISAVKFRYPNGTVVGADALDVSEQNRETVVTFPAREGKFAYTADSGPRNVLLPVVTNRSHEVSLPPGMRVSLPIVGGVTPGGYETRLSGDRVVVTWESVERGPISIDYYYERDLVLFGALVLVLVLVAAAGAAYYYSMIGRLADQREAAGLDVEDEDS
ncbi:MAG: DUF5803 family protein [Halanaeroarchaeum sp.]